VDEPVLWCKDLRKRFKERLAVDGVGFEVAVGETYGLLGPNGAGKTTTISMICGLLRRDGGEVTVAGASLDRDPGQVKAAKHGQGRLHVRSWLSLIGSLLAGSGGGASGPPLSSPTLSSSPVLGWLCSRTKALSTSTTVGWSR
jgi:ABC-type cobalamin/Fe3+-siderophores transport system ATPase subunit